MNPARYLLAPLWVARSRPAQNRSATIRSSARSGLNRRGLHARRAKLAHDMAWRRRARLAHLISPEDRAAFDRDGFVLREEFLPREEFERLRDAVFAHAAPAREMLQGDTITRRIAVDPRVHRRRAGDQGAARQSATGAASTAMSARSTRSR